MWIIKIIKIKYFNPPRILDEHWCIYSCLQIPLRENWFQYLRRVYTTAIIFPCIITLGLEIFILKLGFGTRCLNGGFENLWPGVWKLYSWIWVFKTCVIMMGLETFFLKLDLKTSFIMSGFGKLCLNVGFGKLCLNVGFGKLCLNVGFGKLSLDVWKLLLIGIGKKLSRKLFVMTLKCLSH